MRVEAFDFQVCTTNNLVIVQSGLSAPADITLTVDLNGVKTQCSLDASGMMVNKSVTFETRNESFIVHDLVAGYHPLNHSIVIDSVARDANDQLLFPEFHITLELQPSHEELEAEIESLHWLVEQLVLRGFRWSTPYGVMLKKFVADNMKPQIARRLREKKAMYKDLAKLKHELQQTIAKHEHEMEKNDDLRAAAKDLLTKSVGQSDRALRQTSTRVLRLIGNK